MPNWVLIEIVESWTPADMERTRRELPWWDRNAPGAADWLRLALEYRESLLSIERLQSLDEPTEH